MIARIASPDPRPPRTPWDGLDHRPGRRPPSGVQGFSLGLAHPRLKPWTPTRGGRNDDRGPWDNFPGVVIHAPEVVVKRHPAYVSAKSGDAGPRSSLRPPGAPHPSAARPIRRTQRCGRSRGRAALGCGAPSVRAGLSACARRCGLAGNMIKARCRGRVFCWGHIEVNGGKVIGATVLTGKPYSSVLEPTSEQLAALRAKHGQELENWWQERFGYGFDCLTQSEARYLERSPDADRVRNRIVEEEQTRDCGAVQGEPNRGS